VRKAGKLSFERLHWEELVGTRKGQQKLEFLGRKLWLLDTTIYVFLNTSYFGVNHREAMRDAVKDFFRYVHALERLFNVSFRQRDGYHYRVCKRHVAELGNGLARDQVKRKERLAIADDLGIWLLADCSKPDGEPAGPELEYVRLSSNMGDVDQLTPFFNGLRTLPPEIAQGITPQYIHSMMIEFTKLAGLHSVDIKLIKEIIAKL
jgi:hypothetical protein